MPQLGIPKQQPRGLASFFLPIGLFAQVGPMPPDCKDAPDPTATGCCLVKQDCDGNYSPTTTGWLCIVIAVAGAFSAVYYFMRSRNGKDK